MLLRVVRLPSLVRPFWTAQPARRAPSSATMASLGNKQSSKQKVQMALCQLAVGENKQRNVTAATTAIKEAAQHGAELIVLPEMWNCPYSNDSFPIYAEDIDGGKSESAEALSQAAAEHGITLIGGSIPETSDGKLFNTCLIYGQKGNLLAKHRKVHLFDIDIPGKMTFKESETLTAGSRGTIVDTVHGTVAVGICYDLRFPELAQIYAHRGADIIVYPGAFNTVTGPLHWELLQRARATDNQLFVATCSPARSDTASYKAWGHSTIVSPNGEILGTTDHAPGIVYAELALDEVAERRKHMPLTHQKRHDLYELIDKQQS